MKPDRRGTGWYDWNSIVCEMRESGFPDNAVEKFAYSKTGNSDYWIPLIGG